MCEGPQGLESEVPRLLPELCTLPCGPSTKSIGQDKAKPTVPILVQFGGEDCPTSGPGFNCCLCLSPVGPLSPHLQSGDGHSLAGWPHAFEA